MGVVGAVVDDGAVEGVDVGAGVPPTTVGGRVVVVVEVASAIVVPAAICGLFLIVVVVVVDVVVVAAITCSTYCALLRSRSAVGGRLAGCTSG